MKVIIGGGGCAEQEAEVLARYCSALGANARVLNVPWAQLDPAAPESAAWATSTLQARGVARVDTARSLALPSFGLDAYDGVFMPGGNTYRLLERLRSTELAAHLVAAVRAGFPCYGGSAGAIVLGAHIGTCAHLDRDEVGMSDLRGLDLCGGFAVWCHYTPRDDAKVLDFARKHGLRVLAMAEGAGFECEEAQVTAIGPGVARVWTPEGPLSEGGSRASGEGGPEA